MAKGTAKAKQPAACKHWVFTINNPPADFVVDPAEWSYLIYGRETGESGTPHLQGYGCLTKKARRSRVSKLLPGAWLSPANGTPQENRAYCTKQGDFTEVGTLPKTVGEARDAAWAKWVADAKAGNLDAIPPNMLVRYYSAFRRLGQDYMTPPPDLDAPCGIWIWGTPGVGKSYRVRRDYPDLYDKPLNKWFDGYQGQAAVLLDDVDDDQAAWLPSFLKRWADEYAFPAEMKGTTRSIRPAHLVVTSNHSLQEWLAKSDRVTPALKLALKRRFKVFHQTSRDCLVEEDGVVPTPTGAGGWDVGSGFR